MSSWITRKIAQRLWSLISGKVAEAVAMQVLEQDKNAEKRQLGRDLLSVASRAHVRATGAIDAEDRLRAEADSAYNSTASFKGGAHLARLSDIGERSERLLQLRDDIAPEMGQSPRSLMNAAADDLNDRFAIVERIGEQIEQMAKQIDVELRDAQVSQSRRVDRAERQRDDVEERYTTRANQLKALRKAMPELIREMKADIEGDASGLVREFFVLGDRRLVLSSSVRRFRYNGDEHESLNNMIARLEQSGFIEDVSGPKTAPIYRMTDEFVDVLKSETTE